IEQPEYLQAFLAKLPRQLKDNDYRLTLSDVDIVWTNTKTGEEYDSEPEAGVFRRLGYCLSVILPIEYQL
ncbi:phospholipase D family protein, partial [Vibrio parahaemolyticus]|nr:phospholipase D family protein [Vibrio parahaemolyticus]